MERNAAHTRLIVFLVLILLSVISTQAQSGRRQRNPAPAAPIPTPTPEPTPAPKQRQEDPDIGFLLTMYNHDAFATYPLSFQSIVLRSCADRLSKDSSASVDVSQQDLNRGEAYRKAKAETKTYVVWLQLSQNTMGSSNSGYADLELEYVVFTPGTGKIATSGRSYLDANNRRGPVVAGPTSRGSANIVYTERLLKYAAEDAADRILRALHLSNSGPVITNLDRF